MALTYSVEPMGPRPGKFYIRVYPRATIRREELIQRITSSTSVGSVDVAATLDAIDDQIIEGARQGDFFIIEDFMGITLSVEPDDPITDPNYTIDPAAVKVKVNAQIKNRIQQLVRLGFQSAADFQKVVAPVRLPQINQVFDVLSQQVGKYTPGGPLDITGGGLDLPNDYTTDLANGVFFKAGATETRATIYQHEGDQRITCIVPTSVTAATIDVIVRSDYAGPSVKEGKILGIAKV